MSEPTPTIDNINKDTKDKSRSVNMTGLIVEFIDDWNTIITSTRISRIIQIKSGRRLISLKARLKDKFFLEHNREAMKKVNDDWWPNGFCGDRSWTATIQWFTRPGVVEEIMKRSPSKRKVSDTEEKPINCDGDEPITGDFGKATHRDCRIEYSAINNINHPILNQMLKSKKANKDAG